MNTIHIEDILGSRGRVAVLRVLCRVNVPMSMRQIARQAGLSHAAAGAALDVLVEVGVAAVVDIGRSRVHWLERRNSYVRRIVIPLFEAEDEAPDFLLDDLRAAVPASVYSAVLFGSRARGDNSADSDFDLLVVERDDKALQLTMAAIDREATELRAKLGAAVSVLGYTLAAARELSGKDDNFMRGVIRDGITLTGIAPEAWDEAEEDRNGREGVGRPLSEEGAGVPGDR